MGNTTEFPLLHFNCVGKRFGDAVVAVDELNRAFAGERWSGYVSPLHVVTQANIGYDGGPSNVIDRENGYRKAYKEIWGK